VTAENGAPNRMDSANKTPKHVDISNEIPSGWKIQSIYTDDFLTGLTKRFALNMEPTEIAHGLRDIGRRYVLMSGLRNTGEVIKKDRRKYAVLRKSTAKFINELQTWSLNDLAGDMAYIARSLREPPPLTEFPDLTDHQKKRGDSYYHELLRLLQLLEKTTAGSIRQLTSRGGRPINYGLEVLTRMAADLWTEKLRRRFRVDYHQGAGLSEAFRFVQALLEPLGEIPERKIITAMRAEIKSRNSRASINPHVKKTFKPT
jgi:hypothetical protein